MTERTARGGRPAERLRAEVRAGLSRPQKELSPKYFYDGRGASLFDRITDLPEYYLTRAERSILEDWAPGWIAEWRPRTLVELGPGNADKARVLLDAMLAAHGEAGERVGYVPVDVSTAYLRAIEERLSAEYPGLAVEPVAADIAGAFELRTRLPRPALFAFLGSTIGNFEPDAGAAVLGRLRAAMESGDRLLLGADLKKDVARLEAAYNDAAGVTAAFNLNILRVLNRRLGADFDPNGYEHRAFYNAEAGRIEMHLAARRAQVVTIPGTGVFHLSVGETIRTEVSYKFDRRDVDALLDAAGLRVEHWQNDEEALFALITARPAERP